MKNLFDRLCRTLNRDQYDGYYVSAPYVDYDGNEFDMAIVHGFSHHMAFVIEGGAVKVSLPCGIFTLSRKIVEALAASKSLNWELFFNHDKAEEVLEIIFGA